METTENEIRISNELRERFLKYRDVLPYSNIGSQNEYLGWVSDFHWKDSKNRKIHLNLINPNDLFLLFVIAIVWSRTGHWENAAFFVSYLKIFQKSSVEYWKIKSNYLHELEIRKQSAELITIELVGPKPRRKIGFREDIFESVHLLATKWNNIIEQLEFSEESRDYKSFISYLRSIEGLGVGDNRMLKKIPLILRELRCQNIYTNIPGELCCVQDTRVREAAKSLNIQLPIVSNLETLIKSSSKIYHLFGDLYDLPLFAYGDLNQIESNESEKNSTYYIEQQRQKAILLRDELFNDPGGGYYQKSHRDFVLKNPRLNLWAGIREDAIDYFKRNNIQFWPGGNEPTGHLLSSQIACINHLYFLRQRQDIATAILRSIDRHVRTALIMDNGSEYGFVDFEVIGSQNYLGEKSHTRGANSTSVDALMLAELDNGFRKIFFIEWKYVETYNKTSKAKGESGRTRIKTYKPLLINSDCPVKVTDVEGLFTEPYYQLMRQTLLAHEMIKAKEYGANQYLHLHVIPRDNKELKDVNTASGKLKGRTIEETWKNVLKAPELYRTIDPKELLDPARNCIDCIAPLTYLERRYWS